MGDRISISFVTGDQESITLFAHWSGKGLLGYVDQYYEGLKDWIKTQNFRYGTPLSRLEPNTVMVDFIKWLFHGTPSDSRVESNFYFGIDENHGDNSDNGHYQLDLVSGMWSF